ncbi:UPF0149 family protein [Thaumasiovibrio subtropicus]|uniref:UPF0149 family protein n=1 Tax=Thaumasiovibrio subtropicus TaxID=1891207 RepID=UPI000B34BFC9|nr:UPF0149 family protein [Thaumasiovibrio subtropicus]
MSEVQLPQFVAIENSLKQHGLPVSPSELQGLLVGLISGGHSFGDLSYINAVVDFVNDGKALSESASETTQLIFKMAVQELTGDDLAFTLLLPDDDADLIDRAECLGEWINAFLSGIGLMDLKSKSLSNEVNEVLADLQDIAQLGIDEDDDMQEQAQLFEQVIEHVRMCAMTCFAELGERPEEEQSKPTLH